MSKEKEQQWRASLKARNFNGKNNPMYGKPCYYKMTPEEIQNWKDKISKSTAGKNNPMYGKKLKDIMGEERYEVWKINHKYAMENLPEETKRHMSEKISLAQKKLQEKDPIAYSKLKARGGLATKSKAWNYVKTIPEKLLEQWFIDNNVNYEYSPIMGFGANCFQYDFIIHKKRVLIEVQGDYWHGNPLYYNEDGSDGKKKLNDIQKKKIASDKKKLDFAKSKNFTLICIWESEIKAKNFSKILEVL